MNIRESRIDGSRAVPYTFLWKPPSAVATFDVQDSTGLARKYKVFISWDEGFVYLHFSAIDSQGNETWDRINVGVRAAIQVFHTVWAIMLQYFDETEDPIHEISFTASIHEESRVRFYTTLAHQVASIFDVEPLIDELSKDVVFTLPINVTPTA